MILQGSLPVKQKQNVKIKFDQQDINKISNLEIFMVLLNCNIFIRGYM